MSEKKKSQNKHNLTHATEETLESIIEKSKTSAEAYRKILNSLESKLKKH